MIISHTLNDCLQQLNPIYMEHGVYPFKNTAKLPFTLLESSAHYNLLQTHPTSCKLTVTAKVIYEEFASRTQAFGASLRYAALSPPILQQLTARYCLGLADPAIHPMIRYLTNPPHSYTDAQSRKLIAICIDNFRFSNTLGVKLVEFK